ncbi:pseudouridine synthase, RluA family [Eubacterium saphenum ATCC 49989]|nr:pseudouridine synthase, RluA family [Eubacterium saphenum ATCC 49989]
MKIKVDVGNNQRRADVYIAGALKISRAKAAKLCDVGSVTLDGIKISKNHRMNANDLLEISDDREAGLHQSEQDSTGVHISSDDVEVIKVPEDNDLYNANEEGILKIGILYEDDYIIVVDKPAGLLTHAKGDKSCECTLSDKILEYTEGSLANGSGANRPGVVHRLDRGTCGVMVMAKTDTALKHLTEAFEKQEVSKEYEAIVYDNIVRDSGVITAKIERNKKNRLKMSAGDEGREAHTEFKVIERFGKFTYVSLVIKSGRTHQIRVHMNYIHHPVLGDMLYGKRKDKFNLMWPMLRSKKIGFLHPITSEKMEFTAAMPYEFKRILRILRQK